MTTTIVRELARGRYGQRFAAQAECEHVPIKPKMSELDGLLTTVCRSCHRPIILDADLGWLTILGGLEA